MPLYEFEVTVYGERPAVLTLLLWEDNMNFAKVRSETASRHLLVSHNYPPDAVTIVRSKKSYDVPKDVFEKFEKQKRAYPIQHTLLIPVILGDDIMGYDFALFDYRSQQLIFGSSRFESVQAFTCQALGNWQRNDHQQFYPTKHVHPDFVAHKWYSFV